MNTMQENNHGDTHDPPRNLGVPLNPIPQTNQGTLEHTNIPFSPIEQITDVVPDFSWMTSQFKLKCLLTVTTQDRVGTNIVKTGSYGAPGVIQTLAAFNDSNNKDPMSSMPDWSRLPFSSSLWWHGTVTHRLTIVKPPRVTGKLLVRWRQDEFLTFEDPLKPLNTIEDGTMRSILKEWDLAATNVFEFDVTASIPVRARPTKTSTGIFTPKSKFNASFSRQYYPWTLNTMGGFTVEVAQEISPGSIFPDTYTIIVERAFKDATFMTPTDSKSNHKLVIRESVYEVLPVVRK